MSFWTAIVIIVAISAIASVMRAKHGIVRTGRGREEVYVGRHENDPEKEMLRGEVRELKDRIAVLERIVGQEISPELVPATADAPMQSTEQVVGPYALQDFTLFHVLRHGARPSKVAFLAWHAWRDVAAGWWPPGYPEDRRQAYDLAEIRRWLIVFVRRFFGNQFKRSALPNGPKVSAGGTMSPRGDWRMPSDADPSAWLAEIEANVPVP